MKLKARFGLLFNLELPIPGQAKRLRGVSQGPECLGVSMLNPLREGWWAEVEL